MVTSEHVRTRKPGISLGLTLLFAFVGGAGVGNLYWAQPLLGDIAQALAVGPGAAGLLVTLTQIGYALGVFFVVPLGDTMNRKCLVPAIMACCSLSLAGCVVAPNFAFLLGTLAFVGFTNVAGQMLLPLAGDLATDEQRGRVLGTVASGLLSGILLSRMVSGVVAGLFGWRMIYVVASVTIMILALIMWWAIPALKPRKRIPYGRLLCSVVRVTVQHRRGRVIPFFGASLMCVFTAFWTGLTLLLASPPFSLPASHIGMVSLLGVLGVIGAQLTGRVYDRGWGVPAIGIGLVVTLCAIVVAWIGSSSLIAIFVAVALLSLGAQSVLVLLQTMMVSINPAARSRLNTAHIVSNFVGGAIGSTLAASLWHLGQWPAIMASSAVILVGAFLLWIFQRNRSLASSGSPRPTITRALNKESRESGKGTASTSRSECLQATRPEAGLRPSGWAAVPKFQRPHV